MALEETKAIDQITVTEHNTLEVREITRIMKDGEQIAYTYHRWSFEKGADLSAMPEKVRVIAAAAWA